MNPICIGELLSFGLVTSRYGKKHGERFFFFAASTPSLAAFGFSNGYGYSPCLGWLMWPKNQPSYCHHITMSMGGMGFRSFLRLFPRPGRPGRGWQYHWRQAEQSSDAIKEVWELLTTGLQALNEAGER